MTDRDRTTIELTPKDKECIAFIQNATGEFTTIGAIRHALRLAKYKIEQESARSANRQAVQESAQTAAGLAALALTKQ